MNSTHKRAIVLSMYIDCTLSFYTVAVLCSATLHNSCMLLINWSRSVFPVLMWLLLFFLSFYLPSFFFFFECGVRCVWYDGAHQIMFMTTIFGSKLLNLQNKLDKKIKISFKSKISMFLTKDEMKWHSTKWKHGRPMWWGNIPCGVSHSMRVSL